MYLALGHVAFLFRHFSEKSFFSSFSYGRVQSVKLVPGGAGSQCATVSFMDIKSAAKAHNAEHTLDEHLLSTEYYEPSAYPSGAPASTSPTTPNLNTHTPRFPLRYVYEDTL